MGKIIVDNIAYARVVRTMGKLRFCGFGGVVLMSLPLQVSGQMPQQHL
jgi:hypothetical protein